jgi:two-component system response regulator AlgR
VLERIDPNPRRYFSVAERGRVTLVPVADAVFLKAELKYVTIRTREREFLIEDSLSQIEKEFAGTFVRIHRNCLVACASIRGVERASEADAEAGWCVILDGCSEKLPVSRRQWPALKELLKA